MWGFSDRSSEYFEEKRIKDIIDTYESNLKIKNIYSSYIEHRSRLLRNDELRLNIRFFLSSKKKLSYIVRKEKWYDLRKHIFLEHPMQDQHLIKFHELSLKNKDKTLSVVYLVSTDGHLVFQFIDGDWAQKFNADISKEIQKKQLEQTNNDPKKKRLALENELKKSESNLKKYIKPK